MSSPAIEVVDVAKDYAGANALRGVSVTVERGELFGLVGPDGAGKTTFLRILAGLLTLSGGTVRIAGIDVSTDPAGVKERIGYMSQRFSLSDTLTVAENLLYGATCGSVSADYTGSVAVGTPQPHRNPPTFQITGVSPSKVAAQGSLIRIQGKGFNAIEGHHCRGR